MKFIWFGLACSALANLSLTLVWVSERSVHQMPELMPIPLALSLCCGVWLLQKQPNAEDYAPATTGIAVIVSLLIVVGLMLGVRNFWALEILVVAGATATLSLTKSTKHS